MRLTTQFTATLVSAQQFPHSNPKFILKEYKRDHSGYNGGYTNDNGGARN